MYEEKVLDTRMWGKERREGEREKKKRGLGGEDLRGGGKERGEEN